jgi:hypothetical protein
MDTTKRPPVLSSNRVKFSLDVDLTERSVPSWVKSLPPLQKSRVILLLNTTELLHELLKRQCDLVKQLRDAGLSWPQIGWAIGTSSQAARRRFSQAFRSK